MCTQCIDVFYDYIGFDEWWERRRGKYVFLSPRGMAKAAWDASRAKFPYDTQMKPLKPQNEPIAKTHDREPMPTCPFCGAEINIWGKDKYWGGECTACNISSEGFETEQDAINWWKRRA